MSARGIYFAIPMRLCVFHAHCRDFPKSHVITNIRSKCQTAVFGHG